MCMCACVHACVCAQQWLHLYARSDVAVGLSAVKDLSGLSCLFAPLILRDQLSMLE